MSRQIVLLGCLLSVPMAWANRLEVNFKTVRYTLEYSKEKISLNGNRHRLNLVRTNCNQKIIDQFNKNVKNLIHKIPKAKGPKVPWMYTVDGKKFSSDYKTEQAKALLLIPDEVHRIKLQNKYLCEVKKKKNAP